MATSTPRERMLRTIDALTGEAEASGLMLVVEGVQHERPYFRLVDAEGDIILATPSADAVLLKLLEGHIVTVEFDPEREYETVEEALDALEDAWLKG